MPKSVKIAIKICILGGNNEQRGANLKSIDKELPVPTSWRDIISRIVDEVKIGNFSLEGLNGVAVPIASQDAARITENILDYGGKLASLDGASWETSICCYTGEYWEVLIDLSTVPEKVSDLVMFLDIKEDNGKMNFAVTSIHVP